MGLDYGTRRIGVALSDPLGITAQPHAVLNARDRDLSTRLRSMAEEHSVDLIVVGLPIT